MAIGTLLPRPKDQRRTDSPNETRRRVPSKRGRVRTLNASPQRPLTLSTFSMLGEVPPETKVIELSRRRIFLCRTIRQRFLIRTCALEGPIVEEAIVYANRRSHAIQLLVKTSRLVIEQDERVELQLW